MKDDISPLCIIPFCLNIDDGSELQSALAEWTGQRSVPNVFIGGNHIGGCDSECFTTLLLMLIKPNLLYIRSWILY